MDKKEREEFDRRLDVLHGDHPFDPVVSEAQKQRRAENALDYFRGFIRAYAKFSPEVIDEFYWEEYWGDFPTWSGVLNGSLDKWFSCWHRKLASSGYKLATGLLDVMLALKKSNVYGVTHHWVEWCGFITWFTTSEAVDALENPELYHVLMDRGVPVGSIDDVIDNLIDTDPNSFVSQHKRLLAKQRKEKKKNVGNTK